jgi:hypothetical protein
MKSPRKPWTSTLVTSRAWRRALVVLFVLLGVSGCGSASRSAQEPAPPARLLAEARPIGRGPDFQPPVRGPVIGPCARELGPRAGVHVEVFGANRVVLIPAGIGTTPPRTLLSGRIASAGCYGALVTLEPTGLVLVRPGALLTLGDLFRSWGQRLSSRRVATFSAPAGDEVRVFVDGRRWRGPSAVIPLSRHSEIVVEVGQYVPPHSSYAFPPGS